MSKFIPIPTAIAEIMRSADDSEFVTLVMEGNENVLNRITNQNYKSYIAAIRRVALSLGTNSDSICYASVRNAALALQKVIDEKQILGLWCDYRDLQLLGVLTPKSWKTFRLVQAD